MLATEKDRVRANTGQECPVCGHQGLVADEAGLAVEDLQVLAAKAALYNQVAAHLVAARFPIRDSEELRAAFDPEAAFDVGGISVGREELVRLASERDFVFTNPRQVASALAQRALAEYFPGRHAAFARVQVQAAAHAAPSGEPSTEKKRVLAIDDEPTVRALLRLVLEEEGYEVTVAADGPSGLAAVADAPPDLVIVDFTMPVMTGGEVLRALRKERPGLPVYFLTVLGDFTSRTELDDADCCFVKSSDLTPMLEAIAWRLSAGGRGRPCTQRGKRPPPEAARPGT